MLRCSGWTLLASPMPSWSGGRCICKSLVLRWVYQGLHQCCGGFLSREGAVPVTPEGSDQVEHIPLLSLVVSDPVWPQQAGKQTELDAVPCAVCGDPGGFDNMAICSGCNKCTHSRCTVLCCPCPLSLVGVGSVLGVMSCSPTGRS